MTVDKTGKVTAAQVDVQNAKAKKADEKPQKVEVDMTGGAKPQSQNPLDFIESLTGKKAFDTPEMKAFQERLAKASDEEKAKLAKMTPEQQETYLKEQDAQLLAGIKERRERADNEKTAMGRYIQGFKDDFAGVKDAKGVVATVGAAADAVVNRTRKGFASIDKTINLPQGTTEKVWAGAAALAGGAYFLEAAGGTAGLSATASTVLSNPGTRAVGAMAAAASPMVFGSCSDNIFDEEHNYEIELPRDTIIKYQDITLPPETITVVKHDTLWNEKIVHDTTYVDKIIRDTIIENKTDTIFKTDTIKVPEIKTDTLYLPGEIQHDTIRVEVPGPTVTVPEEWKSPIPDKQKEIFDKLGIDVDKNGKFVLTMNYYDEYQQYLGMKNINGGKSSRDGSMIVYDEIKTGWGDDGLKLGQNETYNRYQYTLSNDGKNLSIRTFAPKGDIGVSNSSGQPNWSVFKAQLADDDKWQDKGVVNLAIQGDGTVKITGTSDLSDGLLGKGDVENSVMYTNPYQGQWRLSDWKVQTGDAQ